MKVNIIFSITDSPLGGGNQFLKYLKSEFINQNIYTEIEDADVILFNSYQYIRETINAKLAYPDKLFVHRIDGSSRLYNKPSDRRDTITYTTNEHLADATIYQSEWSRRVNLEMGLQQNLYETIITNATNNDLFNKEGKIEFSTNRKIKIIASSWSSNINKGFETYQYLDDNLDFSKYEMTFVGNSPVKFKNIKMIEPKASKELAQLLKQHDIYITASKKESCSNSLIEALACGLPALCYNDGGHPETLKNCGYLFSEPHEISGLLEKVADNYSTFQNAIKLKSIKEVAKEYADFFEKVLADSNKSRKHLTISGRFKIETALWKYQHLK